MDRRLCRESCQRIETDVFKLLGQNVAARCKFAKRKFVVERLLYDRTLGRRGRRFGRIEKGAAVAETAGGNAEHLTELSGANYSDAHTSIGTRFTALARADRRR